MTGLMGQRLEAELNCSSNPLECQQLLDQVVWIPQDCQVTDRPAVPGGDTADQRITKGGDKGYYPLKWKPSLLPILEPSAKRRACHLKTDCHFIN